MNETLQQIITDRAGIELMRIAAREGLKDIHRKALKTFDVETRKLLAANRVKYVEAMKNVP